MSYSIDKELDATLNYFRQVYPGQYFPDIPNLNIYPDPNNVCKYVTRKDFISLPKWQSQWVHWEEQSRLILEGKYNEIRPIHYEGIFTLVCNLKCPHCTRQIDRYKRVESYTWNLHSKANSKNTLNKLQLRKIINEIASSKKNDPIGIVWGGGDPTCNPNTYEGMLFAKEKGVNSSFITNGVFIDVEKLLNIEPVLVRISLNCGSVDTYNNFHGLPKSSDFFIRTIKNIEEFGKLKKVKNSKTLLGISLIIDERNFNDTIKACEILSDINNKYGNNIIDYVIIRPVMQYDFFTDTVTELNQNTKIKAYNLVESDGELNQILTKANIPLIPVKDSFFEAPNDSFYKGGNECLAYGLFSEIRYNGDIQICSDSYGDPDFTIGNLLENSLPEIWESEKRKEVIRNINKMKCYKNHCPFNSRGHHHNRILHQVEVMRKDGKIEDVRKWISDLKEVTFPLGHSFFI